MHKRNEAKFWFNPFDRWFLIRPTKHASWVMYRSFSLLSWCGFGGEPNKENKKKINDIVKELDYQISFKAGGTVVQMPILIAIGTATAGKTQFARIVFVAIRSNATTTTCATYIFAVHAVSALGDSYCNRAPFGSFQIIEYIHFRSNNNNNTSLAFSTTITPSSPQQRCMSNAAYHIDLAIVYL